MMVSRPLAAIVFLSLCCVRMLFWPDAVLDCGRMWYVYFCRLLVGRVVLSVIGLVVFVVCGDSVMLLSGYGVRRGWSF